MNIITSHTFFAHAGHDHEEVPPKTISTPEETHQEPQATTISTHNDTPLSTQNSAPIDLWVGGGLLVGLVLIWLVTSRLLKLKLATKLILVMGALLLTGVISYQHAPITSTIALSIGMALALASTLLQLSQSKVSETSKP